MVGSLLIISVAVYRRISVGERTQDSASDLRVNYERRYKMDTSGFELFDQIIPSWKPTATPQQIGAAWRGAPKIAIDKIDRLLAATPHLSVNDKCMNLWMKVTILNSEGESKKAYEVMETIRSLAGEDEEANCSGVIRLILLSRRDCAAPRRDRKLH